MKEAIKQTAVEIRAYKKWFRQSSDKRKEQPAPKVTCVQSKWKYDLLTKMKARATILCMFQAHKRGKIHAKRLSKTQLEIPYKYRVGEEITTLEQQEDVLRRLVKQYNRQYIQTLNDAEMVRVNQILQEKEAA